MTSPQLLPLKSQMKTEMSALLIISLQRISTECSFNVIDSKKKTLNLCNITKLPIMYSSVITLHYDQKQLLQLLAYFVLLKTKIVKLS